MRKPQPLVVLVTAPNSRVARKLAAAALDAKLAACVNLMPEIESHYWWKGRLAKGHEILAVFKTTSAHLKQLEHVLTGLHPYETPEFIALQVKTASRKYLNWWLDAVS